MLSGPDCFASTSVNWAGSLLISALNLRKGLSLRWGRSLRHILRQSVKLPAGKLLEHLRVSPKFAGLARSTLPPQLDGHLYKNRPRGQSQTPREQPTPCWRLCSRNLACKRNLLVHSCQFLQPTILPLPILVNKLEGAQKTGHHRFWQPPAATVLAKRQYFPAVKRQERLPGRHPDK